MYTYEQKELRNEKINSTVNYFIPCLSNHSISSPKCLYIFWLYRKMQRGHFVGCVVAGLLLVARANIYIQTLNNKLIKGERKHMYSFLYLHIFISNYNMKRKYLLLSCFCLFKRNVLSHHYL